MGAWQLRPARHPARAALTQMLNFIQIRNFAIIDQVELELDGGLTVLTGETGAGKSILVDALGLVLGDRADAGALRHGTERGEINASFQLAEDSPALSWLEDHSLDDDGECMVRRVLNSNGRTRCFINNRAVPLTTLRELGDHLADIHGQHEHQSLVRPLVQRQILDHLGGNRQRLEKVAERFHAWSGLRKEIEHLREINADRAARIELLQYQVQELQALNIGEHEPAQLDEEHRRLASAGRLAEGIQATLTRLGDCDGDDESSAQALLGAASRTLVRLTEIDPSLKEGTDIVEAASIHVTEAIDTLRRYLDDLDMDPGRLGWVEDRIASIHELARKHKADPVQLPELASSLARELETLEGADARLDAMHAELEQLEQAYVSEAARLSKARARAAAKMSSEVSALMQALGMPGGRFEVEVNEIPDQAYAEHGRDRIEFTVTANAGQPPGALGKVASGGELSRISLAVQVIAADVAPTGCLVFDEVDAGIGGGVAEIVGRRLRELGDKRQVLCVTHLPQVASQAHHHVRVSKLSDGKTTRTALKPLTADESVEELARMLGGVEITRRTRDHAREMIRKGRGG